MQREQGGKPCFNQCSSEREPGVPPYPLPTPIPGKLAAALWLFGGDHSSAAGLDTQISCYLHHGFGEKTKALLPTKGPSVERSSIGGPAVALVIHCRGLGTRPRSRLVQGASTWWSTRGQNLVGPRGARTWWSRRSVGMTQRGTGRANLGSPDGG